MKIQVNGKEKTLDHVLSVAQLLQQLGWAEHRLAVEVNLEIIPKSAHPDCLLKEGDRVEVVHAIGGG